ncbi:MAG: hypothetical protein ACI3T9_04170 [Romboutsia timonensis]
MDKNTTIANTVTIGGVGLCLGIAQLPLIASIGIMALTTIVCGYLTIKYK